MTSILAVALLVVASVGSSSVAASVGSERSQGSALDRWCLGRATDADEGTPAWALRDAMNMLCAEQRLVEAAGNALVAGGNPLPLRDTYRDPARFDSHRFRYDTTVVRNRTGVALGTEVFRPCTARSCTRVPRGVERHRGPYPAVVIVHGGAANKEMHWWASEALAEHGYLVIAFDVAENAGGDHATDAQDVIDWLTSSRFPFAADLDRGRIGIAGHSQGASTASLLAQIDPRIDAFVAWDNLTALDRALWEDDIGVLPPRDVPFHAPGLGIGADYYFAPRPYPTAPEPTTSNGEGGRGRGFSAHPKHLGFEELRREGIDTMLFVLRAGTHLDFTPALSGGASSRHGEAVSTYLTLAWFDRYLYGDAKRARRAFHRLVVARRFDGSADAHAYGSGIPSAEGNQPTLIRGLSMCDRMSFYFRSRYALRRPEGRHRLVSSDMRSDCLAGAAGR